jgi:exopolysaccharide production protein ExoZ
MEFRTAASAPKPSRARLNSIQVMRGVAALLVVFAHAVDLVQSQPQLGDSKLAGIGHLANFGAIGVDLFFIISGFVMALSVARLSGGQAARRFLRLRWIRVTPPYLIACGLLICLHAVVAVPGVVPWRAVVNAAVFVPVFDRIGYTSPVLEVGWTLSWP